MICLDVFVSVSGLGASLKSPKETSNELLVVLGSRDEQWSVLERGTVRNLQNGLASFELTENFDRFATLKIIIGAKMKTSEENIL